MLCCVGLFGGLAVGQYLGGPWTFVAPAAGFGLGLVADMKLMKGMHKRAEPQEQASAGKHEPAAAPAARGGACCGLASGAAGRPSWLMRLLGQEDKHEMTLAEIRKTYEVDSSSPGPSVDIPAGRSSATPERTGTEG